MGISDSTFRRNLASCKRKGILFEDERSGLRFKAPKKVLDEMMKLYPQAFGKKITRKVYSTSFTMYKDVVLWVKSLVLFNSHESQKSAIRKKKSKLGFKIGTPLRAEIDSEIRLSRKKINYLTNRKSTSSSYFMKQLVFIGLAKDERKVKPVRPITKQEYRLTFLGGKFFYCNGWLMENLCNKVTFKQTSYIESIPKILLDVLKKERK